MHPAGKLGLGTVQWGMAYGIANRDGLPAESEVRRILESASAAGINLLDTAYAYGQSEAVIGRMVGPSASFQVVTKTLPIQAEVVTAEHVVSVDEAFRLSLARLNRPNVEGLLVHAAQNLLCPGGERLWAWLEQVRAAGLAKRIGVSLYDPEQYFRLRERFTPGLVQIPFNIYDRRFARSGALRDMASAGVEVHVRSAFLQGLLLMTPEALPDFFMPIRAHHARLRAWTVAAGSSPLAACLGVCLHQAEVGRVIVGCETATQLQGIIQGARQNSGVAVPEDFALEDEAILNPARWPAVR